MDDNNVIKCIKNTGSFEIPESSSALNKLHQSNMERAVGAAVEIVKREFGPAPSPFSFFVLGSAGRCEQGIWSDQDHGLVYAKQGLEEEIYFLRLGREISAALEEAGYPKCEGNVMASNPKWCKSLMDWTDQIEAWTEEKTWETIRHTLTLLDSRSLAGEPDLLSHLNTHLLQSIHRKHLLLRIVENTKYMKKGVGLLGQLLVETHGPYTGLLNIKETGLLPYINSARILAIHERILETSTAKRLRQLPDHLMPKKNRLYYECQFSRLLDFRLAFSSHSNYDSEHYINPSRLTKGQKKELRTILLDGVHLFEKVTKLVEREYRHGNE